jgi:hypothetical protein
MKMFHFHNFRRIVATALVATLFSLTVGTPRLNAMTMPTEAAAPAAAEMTRSGDMAAVQSALENRVVRQRLNDLGLSNSEIDRRLAKLSDEQLHQVAMQIEQQTAAGDGGGAVITVLIIVILVIVLLRLID